MDTSKRISLAGTLLELNQVLLVGVGLSLVEEIGEELLLVCVEGLRPARAVRRDLGFQHPLDPSFRKTRPLNDYSPRGLYTTSR